MEKITLIPIGISTLTIIPILAFVYPTPFGITPGSINFITIFFPSLGTGIGVAYFLLAGTLRIKKKGKTVLETIIEH